MCMIMADLCVVWQKPTQHYKAILLQLKNKQVLNFVSCLLASISSVTWFSPLFS